VKWEVCASVGDRGSDRDAEIELASEEKRNKRDMERGIRERARVCLCGWVWVDGSTCAGAREGEERGNILGVLKSGTALATGCSISQAT
jgi:hypothetical protein